MDIDLHKDKLFLIFRSISLIILLVIWGAIISSIVSLFGINIKTLPKLIKVILQFTSDISFIIFLLYIYRKDIIKDFKNFFNKNFFDNIEQSFKYWIIGVIIMYVSNIIIALIIKNPLSNNEILVRELIKNYPLFMAFELSIYAPFTEELIFRKSIKEFCNNKYLYIIGSGLLFGTVHIISSLDSPIKLLYLIPYSAVGIAFGALYHKTNNIFSSMVAHSFHNTMSLIILLFFGGI